MSEKPADIDHFNGCMQWDITKFVIESIKDKFNVLQKGILPNVKKVTTIVHARFQRPLLNYVKNINRVYHPHRKIPSPQDDN